MDFNLGSSRRSAALWLGLTIALSLSSSALQQTHTSINRRQKAKEESARLWEVCDSSPAPLEPAVQVAGNHDEVIPITKTSQSPADRSQVTIKSTILSLPGDQRTIWTSPFHIRRRQLPWVLPLAAASGILLATDSHNMERERSNAIAIHRSSEIANYGLGALVAIPAFSYVGGKITDSQRAREAGLLSGEAFVNSAIVGQVLKLITSRERPNSTGGDGRFFNSFGDSSFPSDHAILAWSTASVIAHEYPNVVAQSVMYGMASAVSIARVTGRKHFPSDVVVGSSLGWLIGWEAFHSHGHNWDDTSYGRFDPSQATEATPWQEGSTYVDLDSWVYPALKRLAALGYIQTQFTGLEPWTKRECLRQLAEADELSKELAGDSEVRQMISALQTVLNVGPNPRHFAQLESVYTRYTRLSGTPLRDSYHFGQSMWNDFGRPYDEGSNNVTGVSASAVSGPFLFYARGEYQHAPGRGALGAGQEDVIASMDLNPVRQSEPVPATDSFIPLDMYAGVELGEYALTFGKQSLWLGPGEIGPLMVSDNADPMYSLRLTRTTPLVLPSVFRYLGPLRGEFLFSKLSGHQFPARPFFNLQKISFHPSPNLELGFTRASLWAGVGHPFTFHSLLRNFGSVVSPGSRPGDRNDPGDRKAGFDFSYRVPGLRNWITVYSDSYADDELSPLDNPRRSAFNPGIYLSHFPYISKLDLRAEAVSTQLLTSFDFGPTFFYWNNQYHDANLNKGFLFGNSTGRDGRSYQGWSTYHFSAASTVQFSYREIKTSSLASPGGGTQTDASTRLRWQFNRLWSAETFVQYERWLIPALRPGAQHDILGQLQITFNPRRWYKNN